MLYRHEGKVCDAVIRYLETHRGVKRDRCWSPDNEKHHFPVDLVCQMDDGSQWAFETTSIQAFEDEIKLNIHTADLIKPIIEALSSVLPHSEQYILYVPIQAPQGLNNKEIKEAQNAIIDWIRAHALALPVSEFDEPTKIDVTGVPFSLAICRCQKGNCFGRSALGPSPRRGRFEGVAEKSDQEGLS